MEATELEIVRMLLAHGADINARDSYDNTALMWAVDYSGSPEKVEMLLKAGAPINATSDSYTALDRACDVGGASNEKLPRTVEMLLNHGAKSSFPWLLYPDIHLSVSNHMLDPAYAEETIRILRLYFNLGHR
jgi:ankyrin repeat protein